MSGIDLFLRIFLPSYFVAFILLCGPLGVAAFKRRHGMDPTHIEDPHPVMQLGESYRNGILLVVLVLTGGYAVQPTIHEYLGPVPYLEIPLLRWSGIVLLVLSLVLVRMAQLQMGRSWRFGFDRAALPSKLITHGLFSISRNPIYVGMAAIGVALFLVLPNAVTFAIANLTFVLLQVRIRVEEEFLLQGHGEAYAEYRRRTPRWLFRIGSED